MEAPHGMRARIALFVPGGGAAPALGNVARSLARDAGTPAWRHRFRLDAAEVPDMFPNTSHMESIALFARRYSGEPLGPVLVCC